MKVPSKWVAGFVVGAVVVLGLALALSAPKQVVDIELQQNTSSSVGGISDEGFDPETAEIKQQLQQIDAQLNALRQDLEPTTDWSEFQNPLVP